MKESSFQTCPVPAEQLPINEYEQLKAAWFFGWGNLELASYLKKIIWVWGWGWVITGPIAAASFSPGKKPLLFALSGGAGSAIIVLLIVLQLYLAWTYVGKRLEQFSISYEESGWYDGQVWEKPTEIATRDRLVAIYQVNPILKKLQKTILVLLSLIAISFIAVMYLK